MNSPLDQFKARLRGKLQTKISEDHVQSLLSARRGREALFGRHLFSDPAWDILLELYAAKLGGRLMSTNDLAKAIAIPHSLTVRWVRVLADDGYVAVGGGTPVEQASTVVLSDDGTAKMTQLVNQWGSAFLTI